MIWTVVLAIVVLAGIFAYIYHEEDLQWEEITAAANNHYENIMAAFFMLNSNGINCRYHNVGSIHAEGCSNAGTTMYLQVAKKDAERARQLLSSARRT